MRSRMPGRSLVFFLVCSLVLLLLPLSEACALDFAGGDGSESNPYQIATAAQLDKVRENLAAHYVLIDHIDLNMAPYNQGEGWLPIGGSFSGSLDGNGKTISGLYINRPTEDWVGLFRETGVSAMVRDVCLPNINVTGGGDVGGLVGCNFGTISGCSVEGAVHAAGFAGGLVAWNWSIIEDSNAAGAVCGGNDVGGLVGLNYHYHGAVIRRSYATCNVTGVGSPSAAAGGLVGWNNLTIEDCYATGSVTANGFLGVGGLAGWNDSGGTIQRCYATGAVTGSGGGVVVRNYGVLSDCYYNYQTSGLAEHYAGDPKSSADMVQQSLYTGWDFTATWDIIEGTTYPYLRAFVPYSDPLPAPPPVTSVTVIPSTLTLTYGDDPATLAVSVLPESALQAVTWSSSNDAVATVNGDGLVTPVGAGEATITATAVGGGLAEETDVTVNRKVLTIGGTFAVSSKDYDGNANTAINSNSLTLSGVVDGDTGSVALNAVATFSNANVGEDKDVSLTGSTLTGAKAGNYTLLLASAPTTTANIAAKELTVGGSFTAQQKMYDGNANATINANSLTLLGVADGDTGSVALNAVAAFFDANVGEDKGVSLTGSTLTGTKAGNYTLSLTGTKAGNYTLSLTGAPTATANIAAKELTVTATAKRKVDGAPDPALTYTITSGSLVGTDQITGALIREAGEAPGSYDILQGALSAGGNYQITFVPGVFTIREEPQDDPGSSGPTGGTTTTPQVTVQDGQAQLTLTGATVTGANGTVTGYRYDTPNTLPQQIGAALTQGATNFTLYLEETEQPDVTVPRFVTVPADALAAVAAADGLSFTVSTAAGSLTLPPTLVAALAAQGQPLSLTLYRTGLDTVGNLPVGANATGQPLAVETDLRGATQVNLPLNLQLPENPDERTAFLNSLSVFAVYSDGERVLISNLHFDIDDSVTSAVLTGLSFEAERFGLFTLVRFAYQPLITEVGVPGYAIAGVEYALPACYYQGSDTMMPLRMLERYGVVLDWDVATKTVTITYRGQAIVLRPGSDQAEIDGKLVPIVGASGKPLQPNLVDGRVMLPLRFVSEVLGFKVNWSPSQIITVKP